MMQPSLVTLGSLSASIAKKENSNVTGHGHIYSARAEERT